MAQLWTVTLTQPLGRRLSHRDYATIAASAEEAIARVRAYALPNGNDAEATLTAEVDPDGTIGTVSYYTKPGGR